MDLKTHSGGSVSVADSVFGVDYNEGLVHQIVTAYLAAARAGTSAQKTRSEVSGGGAKPWRQKGTGRARAGTSRSPIWTGGGVTFASKTRDYSQKVNKKMYRGAIRSILSHAAAEGRLIVVDSLEVAEAKTKAMKSKMAELGVEKVLFLMDDVTENVYLASRNIPYVQVLDVEGVDPVSLVRFPHIVATEAAVKQLEERFFMNDQRLYQVILAPHVSEKTATASELEGRHTFRVASNATKIEVRKAVEKLFDVTVRSVQIVNVHGKTKRFGQSEGKRSDWKKAIVRLAEGQDIDFMGMEG